MKHIDQELELHLQSGWDAWLTDLYAQAVEQVKAAPATDPETGRQHPGPLVKLTRRLVFNEYYEYHFQFWGTKHVSTSRRATSFVIQTTNGLVNVERHIVHDMLKDAYVFLYEGGLYVGVSPIEAFDVIGVPGT